MHKKKFKTFFIIIILMAIICFVYYKYFKKEEVINTVKVLDSIDKYSYTLDERDTKYMKEEYNELKKVLSGNIDYKLYASSIAKLFIIDLFTLNNKINKYDVGSVEYVYPNSINNFKLNVSNTIYSNIEDATYNKRKQSLPEVKSVEVNSIQNTHYTIGEKEFDAFEIELQWNYVQDLGYDNSGLIKIIKDNDKVYVVEYNPGE